MRGISRALTIRPNFLAGNWYPAGEGSVAAGAAPGQDSIRAYPFLLEKPVVISELAARVTTLHAANNFQLAIYANNPAANRPTGSPLAVTGNISTAAAAVVSGDITGSDVALGPGLYWACINNSGATAVFLSRHTNSNNHLWLVGSATLANVASSTPTTSLAVTTPVTFQTWGDLTAAVWTEITTAAYAAVWFKAA